MKGGVLTISVANSAWLNELSFLRRDLMHRINQDTPVRDQVTQLRLVVGSVEPHTPEVQLPRREAPPRFPQSPWAKTNEDEGRVADAISRAQDAQRRSDSED